MGKKLSMANSSKFCAFRWNHRYWIHTQTGGFTPAVLGAEVTYALRKLSVVTDNESAWNYIKG